MIIAFKNVGKGSSSLGTFYENKLDFARVTFQLDINDEGFIQMGKYTSTIQYDLNNYTKLEALKDYIETEGFKKIYKSRFYSLFKVVEVDKVPFT